MAMLLGFLAPAVAGVPPGHDGQTDDQTAVVARGAYLARAGDCSSCHTARGGEPMAGGRALRTPFGTIHVPNITPDNTTGIGQWSADDFWKAMHEGVDRQGQYLYPAFPYTSFTKMTRKDVDAIYAWLRTLKPVQRKNIPPELSFPYSVRSLMVVWRALYFKAGVYQANPKESAAWNRGAYLVQGPGHCKDCHSPRNWLGATTDGERLAGGMIPEQHWFAPDLGTAPGNGLDGWSKQDIADFLHTGRSSKGIAFGPMAEVVNNSLQYLTRDDVESIATYLLDRPSNATPPPSAGVLPPPVRHRRERHLNDVTVQGQAIYRKHCAACHGKHGEGKRNVYPPLAGNSSILAADPANAVRKVLLGGFAPVTKDFPRPYSMPPFIQKLTDREVALVVTYVRHAWGNRAHTQSPYATVTTDTVAKYRTSFTH